MLSTTQLLIVNLSGRALWLWFWVSLIVLLLAGMYWLLRHR